MSVLRAQPDRRELPPVRARGPWIAWGLALQVVGVGIPVVTAVAGLAVFGVIALVLAAVVAATASTGSADWGKALSSLDIGNWPPRQRRK